MAAVTYVYQWIDENDVMHHGDLMHHGDPNQIWVHTACGRKMRHVPRDIRRDAIVTCLRCLWEAQQHGP